MNLDFQLSLRPALTKRENNSSASVSTYSQCNSRVDVSCIRWIAGSKTVVGAVLLPVSREMSPDSRIAS